MRVAINEQGWFHSWENPERKFTIKQLGDMLRGGNELEFKNTNSHCFRLEALAWIAFNDTLKGIPSNASKLKRFCEVMSVLLGEKKLLEIIENGGQEEYNKRLNLGHVR